MTTPVNTKGTLYNVLRAIDQTEPKLSLCEIIDDVEHSKSSKFFIDFNLHENKIVVGFEKGASIDDMKLMLTWHNLKDREDVTMSTCGVGIKYFMYYFRGEMHIISKTNSDDTYLEAFINTQKIYDALQKSNNEVSDNVFLEVLANSTSYPKEIDSSDIRPKQKKYFDYSNTELDIPFKPELLFFIDKIYKNKFIENIIGNTKDEEIISIKKSLNSKYYLNIVHENLKIYLKFPNNKGWDLLKGYDTIGHDHRKFPLSFTICGKKDEKNMDIFKYNNNYYQIKKNGGSSLRELYKGNPDIIEELFEFNQYNIDIISDELKKNINGTSCEEYAGIYLKLGSYVINDLPIKSALVKRNFGGAKNYRALLTPKNERAKSLLNIKGLKGLFDLTNMVELNKTIHILASSIYKKYFDALQEDHEITPDIHDIIVVKNSNKNKRPSSEIKDTSGHCYIIRLGDTFWKHGITTGGKNKGFDRVKDYVDKKTYDKIKSDYPNENIYDIEDIGCEILNLMQCKNIKGIESDVLNYINTESRYKTFETKHKSGQISEFFSCNEDDIKPLKQFIKMRKNYESDESDKSDDNDESD